jgi:hypothetical protein
MAEAVAPFSPDPDALVSVARRRGLGIRRRRQALGAVGAAAAVALAVAAPSLVAGDHGVRSPAPMVVGSQSASLDTTQTSAITGRSTAAALLYAVGLQASGTATDFRGQGGEAAGARMVQTYAGFSFTPDGSATAGDVGMNVQYVAPETQAKGEKSRFTRCDTYMEDCKITHLPDGSTLRTSLQRSDYGGGTGMMWTADLVRADHVRVVAFATNGSDVTERDEKITRTQPVLTVAQLEAVVRQPWWGVRVPTYFAEQGDQLSPYTAVGGAIEATAGPSATP